MTMNSSQLNALGIAEKWLDPLNETFAKYEINTPVRQAFFIGQCAHESNNFKTLEENLNYRPETLMKVWPSRFPDLQTADKYAHNPQLLANKVYAGRLGNSQENDGWNFHGRGLIQLTGRENYANCGSGLGVDLVGHPDWLLNPQYAALSAGWFWNKKGLNALADTQDLDTMTKRINGGLLGLDDRKAKIAKALSILG
jgi:putative chitinase